MDLKCPKCYAKVDIDMNQCGKCGFDMRKIFQLIKDGDKFCIQGKYPDAIECYEKAIKSDKKNTIAWYGKANVLLKQGENSEGVTYCVKCQLSPVLSEAFYEEAVKCYEKVTTINPEFKEAWHKKGIALEKLGEGSKAKKCFEIAKELGHVSNPI